MNKPKRLRTMYYADSTKSLEWNDKKFKQWSRNVTRDAIKRGLVIKTPCQTCDSENDLEAHHPDYNHPLDVIWFCKRHHFEFHYQDISWGWQQHPKEVETCKLPAQRPPG